MEGNGPPWVCVWVAGQADRLTAGHRDILKPNEMAATAFLRNYATQSLDIDETEEYLYPGTAVHALVVLEPKCALTGFMQLTAMEEEQRAFYTRCADGACNIGHCFFLKVTKCVCLPHGPMPLSETRGNRAAFTGLPTWFVTDMLTVLEYAGMNQYFLWICESHLCLRLPKIYASLVSHGLMDSIAVCDLGHPRNDLERSLWRIGWETTYHDGMHLRNRTRSIQLPPGREFELARLCEVRDRLTTGELANIQPQFVPSTLAWNNLARRGLSSELARSTLDSIKKAAKLIDAWQLSDRDMVPLCRLHHHAAYLQNAIDAEVQPCLSVSEKYGVLQLIHAFFLSDLVKNNGRMKEICCF